MPARAAAGEESLLARPVGAFRVLLAVAVVVTVGVFPVFLVGGLGVQLRGDLGFSTALLGVAAAFIAPESSFPVASISRPFSFSR